MGWFAGATDPTKNGLWTAYEAVGEIMDIEVVMWGNAQGTPPDVTCQHGEVECWLHSAYACSKGLNPTVEAYLPLINCFDEVLMTTFPAGLPEPSPVNQSFAEASMGSCAKEVGLNFDAINACIGSDQGTTFLAAEAAKTPSHTGVPFGIIDGQTSSPPPMDVITAVCNAYTGAKPDNCTTLAKSSYAWA